MALSPLQKQILRVIAKNRSPDSHVAGGAPFALRSARGSEDIDIFHDAEETLIRCCEIDVKALRDAGFGVETSVLGRSFIDGAVTDAAGEATRIQWSRDSAVRFFPAIKDEVFGYRLHDLDLAVNKVLAMAGRREARDYYDVIRLHREGTPLAALAWAAPAKDPGFTPELILDEINRNSNYPESELRVQAADADPRAMKQTLLRATREARELFAGLPLEHVGQLYLDRSGAAASPDPAGVREGRLVLHGAVARGAWPQLPDAPPPSPTRRSRPRRR